MTTLHPELVKLETQYNDLIDAVQSGSLQVDDALRTLNTIRIIDSAGMAWGMNPDGDFIMGVPGDQPVVTEPERFQGQVLPTQQSRAPWEGADLFTPPSGAHLHRDGLVQAPGQAVTTSPAGRTWSEGPPMLTTSTAGASGDSGDEPKAPRLSKSGVSKAVKAPKAPKAPRNRPLEARTGGASPMTWVAKNKRNVAVGAAALAAVGVLFFTHDADSSAPGSTLPSSGGTASTSLETMPVDPGTAAAPEVAESALPDGDRVNALVSALTSGDRSLAAGALAQPGEAREVALRTAEFGAYTEDNALTLSTGPVAADGDGAVAALNLVDNTSQEQLATATVKFVRDGDAWKIASWPELG